MKKYYKGYIQHLSTGSKSYEASPDDILIMDMMPGVYVTKLQGKDEYCLCNGKYVNDYLTKPLTSIKTNINEHLTHRRFDYYVVTDNGWYLDNSIIVRTEIAGGFVCLNNLLRTRYTEPGYPLTTGNYKKLIREGCITEIDHTTSESDEGLILLVHKPCVLETERFDYHFTFDVDGKTYKDFHCAIKQK